MKRTSESTLNPLRLWDRFFHRPMTSSEWSVLAFIRVGYSVLLLINILVWWPDLETWFGETGVMPLENSRKIVDPDTVTIFQILPRTSFVLWSCYILLIVNLICLMFGFYSRVQCFFIFVLYTSFCHRNPLIFDGEDILFRLMAFYLFLAPIGNHFSINRLWNRKEEEHRNKPVWPLRLIQIQTSMVLFFSGLEKLGGVEWRNGTALYYVSRLDDFFCRFPIPEFLFKSLVLVSLMTWCAVLVEISVPILIWFRKSRWLALIIVIGFHLTLDYTMNLNLFQWLSLIHI